MLENKQVFAKMRITCAQKCELWFTKCMLFPKMSLAFKWLIVLRLAVKTHDQMHQVVKNVFAASQNV